MRHGEAFQRRPGRRAGIRAAPRATAFSRPLPTRRRHHAGNGLVDIRLARNGGLVVRDLGQEGAAELGGGVAVIGGNFGRGIQALGEQVGGGRLVVDDRLVGALRAIENVDRQRFELQRAVGQPLAEEIEAAGIRRAAEQRLVDRRFGTAKGY